MYVNMKIMLKELLVVGLIVLLSPIILLMVALISLYTGYWMKDWEDEG